ncbi:hypothetical protein QBC43DRAFT_363199 [Cladorrhinum sp. PSN259]|nr:hypothetical protein QBC43DRAFT_363199 [Cladorrhinum sp. PSN259]
MPPKKPSQTADPEPVPPRRGPGRPKGSGTGAKEKAKVSPQRRRSTDRLRDSLDSLIQGARSPDVSPSPKTRAEPARKPRTHPPKPVQSSEPRSQAAENTNGFENPKQTPPHSLSTNRSAVPNDLNPAQPSKSSSKKADRVSGPGAPTRRLTFESAIKSADTRTPQSMASSSAASSHSDQHIEFSSGLVSSTPSGKKTIERYIGTWSVQREATKKERDSQQGFLQLSMDIVEQMREEREAVSLDLDSNVIAPQLQLHAFLEATKKEATQVLDAKGMELDYLISDIGWADTATLLHIGEAAENEVAGVLDGLFSSGNMAGIMRLATRAELLDDYGAPAQTYEASENTTNARENLTAGKKRARSPANEDSDLQPPSKKQMQSFSAAGSSEKNERLYFVFRGYILTEGGEAIQKTPHTMRGHVEMTNAETMEGRIMGCKFRFKKTRHLHLKLGKACKWRDFSI